MAPTLHRFAGRCPPRGSNFAWGGPAQKLAPTLHRFAGRCPPRGRIFAWGGPAQKLVSTLAGMTCLMRGSVGDILAAPGGAEAIARYLDACIAVKIAAPSWEWRERCLGDTDRATV